MDFDFKTFSTRSFEHFSQSMALHVLGKGVLVFGDGPDGAREATYDGTLNYPSEVDKWSGYTVMQAKFRQVPGTPKEDADWLVGQIHAELKKYTEPKSKLRKPDFYILVSNVRLSPMASTGRAKGGIDKVNDAIEKYKNKIGIKDFRVWHLDQLCTMLAGANEIRRSYAAWLSSSDVIADLLDDIHKKSTTLKKAMFRYLARELRSHQPLRLQQAGHSSDAKVMIEDVFVDLPFRRSDYEVRNIPTNQLLLATLLERSRDCFSKGYLTEQYGLEGGRPERILLLGGPGQGKSTLSQFLAQIFRANLLRSTNANNYSSETGPIIESTLHKVSETGINANVPLRFPLRGDLPHFADWLSSSKNGASLILYLAEHISTIAGTPVNVEDLRDWISQYPIILILDGLDEVPPSANRDSVLRAISEFWDEATNSDLLMVVTTRPQGYNDELDPNYYSKFEMTPLTKELALTYATKLAKVQIADPMQCERVIIRLEEAAKNTTTERLMVSPLQVAILLALIDLRGDVPTDRWSLFDKYFSIVLQREQAKAGSVGQTMQHWARQISAIHYQTGFLLHVEAETKGNSESYLSQTELGSLIKGQLQDEGYEGEELQKYTQELLAASTERLVLIVQREENRFSFEVRSLQEFMAAAYLMTGDQVIVQKRLRTIANHIHWLHVFQIAASKCFSVNDAEHYRDTIITICSEINESEDDVDRLLRTGSKLAIELLNDGLAYDQPKYRRLLLKVAVDLLHGAPDLFSDSLSNHCNREPAWTVEHLRRYFPLTFKDLSHTSWKLILDCSSKGYAWVEPLLDEFWPDNPNEAVKLLKHSVDSPTSAPLYTRMRSILENGSPIEISRALNSSEHKSLCESYPCLTLLTFDNNKGSFAEVEIGGQKTLLSVSFNSLAINIAQQQAYKDLPNTQNWEPLHALNFFHQNPSIAALTNLLDCIESKDWWEIYIRLMSNLPWPLATMVMMKESGADIHPIIDDLRLGNYGDHVDWLTAEGRWNSDNIVNKDFEFFSSGKFFDSNIASVGISPPMSYSITHGSVKLVEWLDQLLIYGLAAQGLPRRQLRRIIRFVLTVYATNMSREAAIFLVEMSDEFNNSERMDPEILANFPLDLLSEPTILEYFDKWGKSGKLSLNHLNTKISLKIYQTLMAHLDNYPGLIIFLLIHLIQDESDAYQKVIEDVRLSIFLESNHPTLTKYTNVLSIILGRDNLELIREVLEDTDRKNQRLPASNLLFRFLQNKNLERERGLMISETMAEIINSNPTLPHKLFLNQLKTFANTRKAQLCEFERWSNLKLSKNLFEIATNRRSEYAK